MDASSHETPHTAKPQLIVTRIVGAPLRLVFDAWTTPEHLAHWWGPTGSNLSSWEIDFRVGGLYRLGTRLSFGHTVHVCGRYLEIVDSERIVFTWAVEQHDGLLDAQTMVMARFAPYGEKTRLTVRHAGFSSDTVRDDQQTDWEEALARLAAYGRKIRVWPVTLASE